MLTEEEKKKIAKQNEAWAKSHKAGSTVSDTQLLSGLNTSGKSSSSGSKSSSGGGSSAGSKYASTSKPLSDEEIAAKWERKYGQSYDKRDTKDGKHDFVDRIANRTSNLRKEWQIRRNEQESSDIFETRRLQQRDDFDELAERGAALADQRFGLGNKVQRAINQSGAQADFLRRSGVPEEYIGKGYVQNIYDYMTPLQRSTYNAFIGMGNRQGAKAYLRSIEAELNQQAANAILPNRENDGFVDTLAMAIDAGASSYINNERQRGKSDSIAPSYQEIVHDEVRPTLTGAQGLAADVGYTIGQQILPVAGSMLFSYGMEAKTALKTVRALTSAAMGANAGAGAYREAVKDSNTDKFDAHVYGLINGAFEGFLQYALGGIRTAGSGGIVKALGKTGIDKAVAKKLANVSKAAATTPAVKNLIRAMVASGKYIGGSADEAIEEWLQAVIDVPIRNYIFDENNEIQPFSEDKLYAGLLGALTAGVMNAANVPSDFVNADQTLQNAAIEHERKKNGKKGPTTPVEPLELTPEQQAQVEGDTKLKDLASHVAQLQAQLANTKNKKQRETLQAKLDKYTKQLEERLNAAPQAAGSTQSTNNAQPVEPTEEAQPVESGQLISNEVGNVPQEEAVPPNLSGIDMIRRGLERGRGEQGRGLIGAGLQNGNGIISPQTDLTRPTGERLNNQQQRGVMPGDTRRQNILNREEQRPEALPFEEPGGRGRVGAQEGNSAEMVNWYRTGVSQSVAEYASGTMPLRGAQTGIRTQVDNFRNYARDVLGWPEDRIEAEVASWNIPAELMQEPQLPPRTGFRMERQQPSAQQQAPAAQQQAATPDVQQEAAAVAETRQELQESKAELADLKAQLEELKSQLVESGQVTDEDIDNILNEPEQEQPPVDNGLVTDEDIQQAVESAPRYTPAQVVRAYRKAVAEAEEYYKLGATKAQYAQDIKNAKNNFLYYAAEAGMSQEEIQAELDRGPQVTDRDINSTTRTEDLDAPPTKSQDDETDNTDESQSELKENVQDVIDAMDNGELSHEEAYDEIVELLNQQDQEREEGRYESAPDEYNKPRFAKPTKGTPRAIVNVTEGQIEVRFENAPNKTITGKLHKAGFEYDKKEKLWWGGRNDSNIRLIEQITGRKDLRQYLSEPEFTPKVTRIPGAKEGSKNAIPNQDARRESDYDDGRGMGRLAREAYAETKEARRADANERERIVGKLNIKPIPAEQFYKTKRENVKISGSVKPLPDTFMDAVDKTSREWQLFAQAYDTAKKNGTKANIKLYSGLIELHYTNENGTSTSRVDAFFDEETNTIWLNVSDEEFESGIYDHEELHSYIDEDLRILDVAIDTLKRAAGTTQSQLEHAITMLIESGWEDAYGPLDMDIDSPNYNFDRYVEELICNIYGGAYRDLMSPIAQSLLGVKSNSEYDNIVISMRKAVLDFREQRNPAEAIRRQNGFSWLPRNIKPRGQEATRSTFTPDENGERPVDRWTQEMQDALPEDIQKYIRKHQADTNGEAWRAIVKKGGVDKVSGTLLKASRWNPQQLEMATEISKYFAEHGETDRASEMVSKLLNQQTEFGRAIQFLQTLQKYMPHAVASVSHSIANELDVELTDEEKADIGLCDSIIENGYISDSMIEQASPEFAEWLEEARPHLNNGQLEPETAAYAAAMRIVVSKAPASKRDKFRALQRISLLSNPKTHIRNILGNAAEQTGTIMARPAAALADRALGKMFGNGQRTFGSGGGQAFLESTVDAVERAKMDYDLGISTVGNKFDESTKSNMKSLAQRGAFDEEGHGALRNGIGKALNKIDGVIGLGLSAGDAPFLLGTYDSVLTQLMDAQGVDEATPEMIETALDVAYRRTFRDDNAVTKALSSVRESLPFIGETVAPYVQTPVNVVLTAVQYSPIGFAEAVIKTFFGENSLRSLSNKGESTMRVQRQVADLIGRGAVGSAFMLIGILMAAAGKITPDDDDIESTKEKNWNTATGRRGSSIKFGDRYVDPSSLQSLSTPLMAGAAAYDRDEEGNLDWAGILGAAVKASMKMGNTMLEMPVLQGVADLFSGNYDNGELLAGMLSLASDAATQAIPFASLGRQVAKTFDPYSRVQSEINEGPFKRIVKNGFNDVRAMTPGVRQTLPERRDVLGNPIKNDASKGFIGRAYNSLLNPFNTSRANSNEVTDEIDRLFAALQDTDVLPTAAGNSLSYGGEKYKFSSAEKQEFQRIEGESNMELLTSLVNSSAYDGLSDEEKMDVIKSVYDYSSDKAKRAYLDTQGIEYGEEDNLLKWPATIDSLVETGIDIGSALIYRKQISAISDKDEQVYYINSLDLNADQKGALDEAFISRWTSLYNDKTRDYTNEDTLNLSMTSDSSQRKYEARFKNGWYGSSGTHYPGIDTKMYKDLCDAYWFKDSPKAEESRQSIKRMLMEAPYYMDEEEADQFSYDFRKRYGSTKD